VITDKCVNSGLLNADILIKKSDTCVNSGLLNDDTLIKINVLMVVYWMMIFWLKQSDTCVNGGLLKTTIDTGVTLF
jgi:hypothetical protein